MSEWWTVVIVTLVGLWVAVIWFVSVTRQAYREFMQARSTHVDWVDEIERKHGGPL